MMQLVFLSFVGPNYSRSSVVLNGKSNSFQQVYYQVEMPLVKAFRQLMEIVRKHKESSCIYVVMSPCQLLVLPLRILTRSTIILDAGWTLTEGATSRKLGNRQLATQAKSYFIDFTTMHLASVIFLETNAQIKYTRKLFLLSRKKLEQSFTGINKSVPISKQENMLLSPGIDDFIRNLKNEIVVLFRGRINSESGFSIIAEATKLVNPRVRFLIVIDKVPKNVELGDNCFVLNKFTDSELAIIYQISDICVGQVSNHPRLRNTIPHKAFEAAYFKKPYISTDSIGIRELAPLDSQIFYLSSPDVDSLVSAIDLLSTEQQLRDKFAKSFHQRFIEVASQAKIIGNLERILFERNLLNIK
jgi:glycosyltransferase involved in cell wall biosynthesis